MTLSDMRTLVRRDLKDEDSQNYRWTDDELDRHIAHAVREFSQASPREMMETIATTPDSREIDVSALTDRVTVFVAEYPINKFPPRYQRFSLYQDTLTLLGDEVPDGSNARIFYGSLYMLDDYSSTIPTKDESTIAIGTAAYALLEYAVYTINRVNVGGTAAPGDFRTRGEDLLRCFRDDLRRLKSRLRTRKLYTPTTSPLSKSADWGP